VAWFHSAPQFGEAAARSDAASVHAASTERSASAEVQAAVATISPRMSWVPAAAELPMMIEVIGPVPSLTVADPFVWLQAVPFVMSLTCQRGAAAPEAFVPTSQYHVLPVRVGPPVPKSLLMNGLARSTIMPQTSVAPFRPSIM
jgi:hypothetical protein